MPLSLELLTTLPLLPVPRASPWRLSSFLLGGDSLPLVAQGRGKILAADLVQLDHPLSHEDFLFGSASKAGGTRPWLRPKISMVAGLGTVAGAVLQVARKHSPHLPFTDGEPERDQPTGWTLLLPRALRACLAFDVLGLFLLGSTLHCSCDVPLRSWFAGGLLLGFPASRLVENVAKSRPSFRFYRLHVTEGRSCDGEATDLDGLVLYDQFGLPMDMYRTQQRKELNYWFVTLAEAELVTGYHLITSRSSSPQLDPSSWVLEGSYDGVTWQMLDECEGETLPDGRGVATFLYEDLAHLVDGTAAFRRAFLVELALSAASFAWLIAGSAWVSQGTETCVDTAPLLWYSSYFTVVLVWSFLGTVTTGLIVSTVAMIILGRRTS